MNLPTPPTLARMTIQSRDALTDYVSTYLAAALPHITTTVSAYDDGADGWWVTVTADTVEAGLNANPSGSAASIWHSVFIPGDRSTPDDVDVVEDHGGVVMPIRRAVRLLAGVVLDLVLVDEERALAERALAGDYS